MILSTYRNLRSLSVLWLFVLRVSTIKSIYKILKSTCSRKLYEIFRSSKAERGRHYITIFIIKRNAYNSIIDFYQCAPRCAVEKRLTMKSTLYMSRQRYIEEIYHKIVIDKTFSTSWKGDTRFPTERRFTQWCRNLNYKRNIIEDKRDNKNILLL